MSRTSDGSIAADIIRFLKNEARLLHKEAEAGDEIAIRRLNKNSPAVALGAGLQRKHALSTVARETGFTGWKALMDCFESSQGANFGAFLHPKRCHIHWNIWLASYEEARQVRAEHGGYLLSYNKQFLVVDADYVTSLGIDPLDPLWEKIGRDWVQPDDFDAREELALAIAREHLRAVKTQSAAA